MWKVENDTLFTLFVRKEAKRRRERLHPFSPKKSLFVWGFLFPEVPLEQASEGLAVS